MPPPPPPPPAAGAFKAKGARYKEQNAKAVVLRKPLWEDKFPLHAAAQAGSRALVAELLPERRGRALPLRPAGAQVNVQDEDTWTAAHYACYYGHVDVLHELLLQGANPNSTNLNGCGLLQFAAGQGHEPCALLLLSAGADARHHDEDGNTPASLARQLRPERWAVLEVLCLLCRDFIPVLPDLFDGGGRQRRRSSGKQAAASFLLGGGGKMARTRRYGQSLHTADGSPREDEDEAGSLLDPQGTGRVARRKTVQVGEAGSTPKTVRLIPPRTVVDFSLHGAAALTVLGFTIRLPRPLITAKHAAPPSPVLLSTVVKPPEPEPEPEPGTTAVPLVAPKAAEVNWMLRQPIGALTALV